MTEYAVVRGGIVGVRNPGNDSINNGDYSIKGQVKELGNNIPCRVRLFEKNTGRLIADVATDEVGNYKFLNLIKTKFFIVAHHPQNQYNAVIQDNIIPE